MSCQISTRQRADDPANPNPVVCSIVVDANRVGLYAFRANSTGPAMASNSAAVADAAGQPDGRAEQPAADVLAAARDCVDRAVIAGRVMGARVAAVGVANHRGSVVAWDRHTGGPLSPLIRWSDNRAAATADAYRRAHGQSRFQAVCGLPLSHYFSAFKIKWLIDNDDAVRDAHRRGDCYFGTVDAWLVWNLTGGPKGGVFATDSTNAAQTFLMNINTLEWDKRLLKFFGISRESLPKIKSSSELYGYIADGPLEGVPITGVIGNRQASLVGHNCMRRGLTKVTLDDGGTVFTVTGEEKIFSKNGLLTTIAYHLDKRPVYALEGPIASVGKAIEWSRKCMKVEESYCLASKTRGKKPNPVYFVPAFDGLFAPHWRPEARCVLVGIDDCAVKDDIYEATMESACYQVQDVLEAVNDDLTISVDRLKVDGYVTGNPFVMQSLANITNARVEVSASDELVALGAAMAAGYAAEANVWNAMCMPDEKGVSYDQKMTVDDRRLCISDWKRALRRSYNWTELKRPTTSRFNSWLVAGASTVVGIGALALCGYVIFKRKWQ